MANNKGKSGGGYTGIGPGGGGYTGWEPSPPPVIEPPRVVITPTIPEPSPPPDVGPPQYTPASGPGTQVSRGGTIYEFRGGAWNPVGSGGGTSPGSPREVIVSEPTTPEPVLETITPAEDLTRKPYKEEGAPGTTILATERYFSMLAQREAARTAPDVPTTMPEHPVTKDIGMTTFKITPEEYTEKIGIGGRTFVYTEKPPEGMVFDIEAAKKEAKRGKGLIAKATQEELAVQFPTKVEYKYTPEQIEFAKEKARGKIAEEIVGKATPTELKLLGLKTVLSPYGGELLGASLMRESRKPAIAKQLAVELKKAEEGEPWLKWPEPMKLREGSKLLPEMYETMGLFGPGKAPVPIEELGGFGRGMAEAAPSPVVQGLTAFVPGYAFGKLLKIPKVAEVAMTGKGKALLGAAGVATIGEAGAQIVLAEPPKRAETAVHVAAGFAGFGAGLASGVRTGLKTWEVTKVTGLQRGRLIKGEGIGLDKVDTEITFGALVKPTEKAPIEMFSTRELMGGKKTVTDVATYYQTPKEAAWLRRMEFSEPKVTKEFTLKKPTGKIPKDIEMQEVGSLTRATSGRLGQSFAAMKRVDTLLLPYKRPPSIRYGFVPKKEGKPRDVLKEMGDYYRKKQQRDAKRAQRERAAMARTRGRLATQMRPPPKPPKPTRPVELEQAAKEGVVIGVKAMTEPKLASGMGLISGQMSKQEQEARLKQMRSIKKASKMELMGRAGMGLGFGLKPTFKDDMGQLIGQKPAQRQRQRVGLRPGLRTRVTPEYPPYEPRIRKPRKPWIPKFPGLPEEFEGLLPKKAGKRVKALQGTKYTPSLSGLYVGGKQKKPKRLTGLEIRRVLK